MPQSMTIFLRMTTDTTLRVKNGINTKTMLSLWLGTFIQFSNDNDNNLQLQWLLLQLRLQSKLLLFKTTYKRV